MAGSSVGAGVAGAQAASASARTVITAKNRYSDFFIFSPLDNMFWFGKASLTKLIIQRNQHLNK
jgi:hypothetical protein